MERKFNILTIFVFMCMISLPWIFAHREKEGRVSSMENRRLAGYPAIRTEEGGFNRDYIAQYENWLKDNLRGRTVIVEADATLQYQLFRRIVKEDTMSGKSDWLFVRDDEMIREHQRLNLMPDAALTRYAAGMQGISDYLEDRGIAFYYLQCYSKEEIYPDQYLDGVCRTGTLSKADQIVKILQENTDVDQILVKEALTARADELLYFQYVDSLHWNERGSFLGYQILMNDIHEDFAKVPVLEEKDFTITEEERSVDLYGFTYPYTEMCPVYQVKEPMAREITSETKERWDFLHYKEHTHVYSNENCTNDMKILILGDSFIRMFLKDDIAESFRETLSIDWLNIPILDEVVEEFEPDIVVIESAQSALKDTVGLISESDLTGE